MLLFFFGYLMLELTSGSWLKIFSYRDEAFHMDDEVFRLRANRHNGLFHCT